MITASANFLSALKSPIKTLYLKFDFYTSSGVYIDTFTQYVTKEDIGVLSIQRNRPVRRSFSFNFNNQNGIFTFGSENFIWLNKMVKLYVGLQYGNTVEYILQGVFILTDIKDSHSRDGKITYLTGQDKMINHTDRKGVFKNQLTVEAGTNVATAIKLIAQEGGETQFNFDTVTEVVPYEITFDIGSSRYDAMKKLADFCIADIFYDEFGYLRLKKIVLNDIQNYPAVWKYEYNNSQERFYAGNIRTLDTSQLANSIVVRGGSSSTATCSYQLVVDENNPLWTGNAYSIQNIGEIVYLHNNGNPDPILITNDDCKYRAKYELMNRLGYNELVEMRLAPNYLQDVLDVIEIIDLENNVNGHYLVESINMPLNPDEMVIQARKQVLLINNWDFI